MQIRNTLVNLGKAVKGLAVMSSSLESVGTALYDGKVPALWLKKSFPSLKPLGAYIKEVHSRVAFFQGWIDEGPPVNFWLPGFFFTQVSTRRRLPRRARSASSANLPCICRDGRVYTCTYRLCLHGH